MPEITFTQYLRPNGRKQPATTECSDEAEKKAKELIEAGAVFEIEVLMTEQVSMTVEPRDEEQFEEIGFYAHEIITNGPQVPIAVERLVRDAYDKLKHIRRIV